MQLGEKAMPCARVGELASLSYRPGLSIPSLQLPAWYAQPTGMMGRGRGGAVGEDEGQGRMQAGKLGEEDEHPLPTTP